MAAIVRLAIHLPAQQASSFSFSRPLARRGPFHRWAACAWLPQGIINPSLQLPVWYQANRTLYTVCYTASHANRRCTADVPGLPKTFRHAATQLRGNPRLRKRSYPFALRTLLPRCALLRILDSRGSGGCSTSGAAASISTSAQALSAYPTY